MNLKTKKILISGGKGMLGSELSRQLRALGAIVFDYDIEDLDICSPQSIQSVILNHSPDIFINCAAYTAVDKSETDSLAMKVNGDAIQNLVNICGNEKIKLVHFSTDYIYSGDFTSPIEETEIPIPINLYGEGKLKGDKFIIDKPNLDYLLFRIQWLYGNNGKNFVDTMLRLSGEKKSINVVSDQIGRPTSTKFVAGIVIESLESDLNGIYNAGPSDYCSWFDFASYILKDTGCEVLPISSAQYPTPAKRPLYSVLSVKKIQKTLRNSKFLKLGWRDLVDDYLKK